MLTTMRGKMAGLKYGADARVSAIGFYLKAGFKLSGRAFSKGGVDYEAMEKAL
jgi:hypothetical protein